MPKAEVRKIDARMRRQMDRLLAEARAFGLSLAEVNLTRPWGGYVRFEQSSLVDFLHAYWLDVDLGLPAGNRSLDPKLLLVAPRKMLSLQWHRRRREIWRVVDGPVRIVKGTGWDDLRVADYQKGEVINIGKSEWHRLIGCAKWGRVAEIWSHSEAGTPSDEGDVLRVHDLYRRANVGADPSTPLGKRAAKWKSKYRQLCSEAGLRTD